MYRFVAGAIAIIPAYFVAAWAVDRDVPAVVNNIEVVDDVVPQGGVLRFKVNVTRYRVYCAYFAQRMMIDSKATRFILDEVNFIRAAGSLGTDEYVNGQQLPHGMATGPAVYNIVGQYTCNPVHYLWPILDKPIQIQFTVG